MSDPKFYGLVKTHESGVLHLVEGRKLEALCGAHARGDGWAVVMRSLVGLPYVREATGTCHGCVAVALGRPK